MGPGGLWWSNVLNSALPPQRLRPDTWPEQKDPVSHTAQKKREEERKEGRKEGKKERKKERKKENKRREREKERIK